MACRYEMRWVVKIPGEEPHYCQEAAPSEGREGGE